MRSFLGALIGFVILQAQSPTFADSCVFQEEYSHVSGNGEEFIFRRVKDLCEMWPGIWAKGGASFYSWATGERYSLWHVGKESIVGSFRVGPGASVVWHKNGQLHTLSHFVLDTEVASGIWASQAFPNKTISSRVNWDADGKLRWVQVLGRDLVNQQGVVLAKRCQSVWFKRDGSNPSCGNSLGLWSIDD